MPFPSISGIILWAAMLNTSARDEQMTLSDVSIVIAAILGPILAVQAQKSIERFQAKRQAKDTIFKTLMATRATRLSIEHVQALNGIEIAFYATGKYRTYKKEKKVLEAWKEYHDHLNKTPSKDGTEKDWDIWTDNQIKLFIDLLHEMAICLGYDFDKTQIKNGWYAPEAHATVEKEMHLIRRGLAEILTRTNSLPIVSYAATEQEANEVTEMRKLLIDWLKRNHQIQTMVITKDSEPASPSTKQLQ